MLEAIAAERTHIRHIHPDEEEAACSGRPIGAGVMGLIAEGKGCFRANLSQVAALSGYAEREILQHPRIHILAFAAAYDDWRERLGIHSLQPADHVPVLRALSEIPVRSGQAGAFAADAQLYSLFTWLNAPAFQQYFELPAYHIDLPALFGEDNFRVLSAWRIIMDGDRVTNEAGDTYRSPETGPCYDSPGVIWVESPNYSSRAGTAVSAVTVHTTQGSYAGAISWFQNPASQVSAHYVIRSSDGQVTQMVCEADKGWHVGTENAYTIGIEHEGYIADASWYTSAMYLASSAIVRDIVNSGYGINPLRTYHGPGCTGSSPTCGLGACTKVKGHQQFPNQTHTDPGQYWNWDLYYNLINNTPAVTVETASSGTVYDPGGANGNYSNDIRQVVRIAPIGAAGIALTVNSFSTELNYDYLYIYDGSTYTAPLIGRYSGTAIPTTFTSSGGSLLLDFRTDCSTIGAGYSISWSAVAPDITAPTTAATVPAWATADFTASFTDADEPGGSGINKAFYQVADYDGTRWSANAGRGFFEDEFSGASLGSQWTVAAGTWALFGGALRQSDESLSNTNIYAPLTQNLSNAYVFHWQGKISGTGTNKRAGLHFFCQSPTSPNRGISYFVYMREDGDKVQIYEVDATDTYTLVHEETFAINNQQTYDYKVFCDRILGQIKVYVDDALVAEWTDPTPISNGGWISFRSGNCQWTVDNVRVYRSRYPSALVTVGHAAADIRYPNVNPGTASGRIRSLVRDNANNLSAVSTSAVQVDWSAPAQPVITSESITYATANGQYTVQLGWGLSADAHSGVQGYAVSIGTVPGGADIVPLTSLGQVSNASFDNLTLTEGTTYYQTLIATNGAGLASAAAGSTGVTAGCAPPANLHETNITATGVRLNWTAVSHKLSYQVRIRQLGSTGFTTYVINNGNSLTLNNLQPGTTYQWSVRTRCLSGVKTNFAPNRTFNTVPALWDTAPLEWPLPVAPAEIQGFQMAIVPNPVTEGAVELWFDRHLENAVLTVTGIDGQVHHRDRIGGESHLLEVGAYPAGIYFVTVQQGEQWVAEKLVKTF